MVFILSSEQKRFTKLSFLLQVRYSGNKEKNKIK